MKRFVALTLLFTSFVNFTSCSAKYQVNEQEFWDAIGMKGVQYLQYTTISKGANLMEEMSPNISHSIRDDVGDKYYECYVKYKSGSFEDPSSYDELCRSNPNDSFVVGGYPEFEYTYPEEVGQIFVEDLEKESITYQDFKFQNNMYCYSYIKVKFENKRLVWIDTGDAADFDSAEFTYQQKVIVMPEPGDK